MNENLLNQVLKTLVSKTGTGYSSPDLKSKVLTNTLSQISKTTQTPVDSITQSSSAEELLSSYQLQPEEENVEIVNSFLNKGYTPSKEEIENIRLILENLPEDADVSKTIEKSVKSTIQGLDLENEIVREVATKNNDKKNILKEFQELKEALVKDNSIPANVRVEISKEIELIQKEIEQSTQVVEPSNQNDDAKAIEKKIKTATNQSDALKDQKVVAIATKGLEKIKTIVTDGVSDQIQKDEVLKNTKDLYEEIGKIKERTVADRKELIAKIEVSAAEFTEAKISIQEIIQKTINLQSSKESINYQNVEATLQEKIPVFLESLSSSDEILEKFGEYISSFPQSIKPIDSTANKNISSPEIPKNLNLPNIQNQFTQKADEINIENKSLKNILSSLEIPASELAENTDDNPLGKVFNEEKSTKGLLDLANNPTFKLLSKVGNIAESLQNNLQAIKKVIDQTTELPASTSLKNMMKLFQESYPTFFKAFDKLNLSSIEFPEFQKIQSSLLGNNTKVILSNELNTGKEVLANAVAIKTINLDQLRDELEQLEIEHFKASETISSLKKVHEAVSKSEAKLAVHQYLESTTVKSDSFHALEFSINHLQETKLAKVEIQHNRKTEDSQVKNSYSVNIEVDLSQTGEVKARLFTDEKSKQIFINFADNDFKNRAIENQTELQTQLKEIPFISQLFFGNINKSPVQEPVAERGNNNLSPFKFDSLA